jgi:hypothetical protein
MSDQPKPFSIDLNSLKTRRKDTTPDAQGRADVVAESHGFLGREPARKRGRQPSPRTGQVHAKVLPHIADEIAEEARRRGVQQGVIIEEAWTLYKAR